MAASTAKSTKDSLLLDCIRSSLGTFPQASDGTFNVYSSTHAPPGAGANTHVLTSGTSIDSFVALLTNQEMVLAAAPATGSLTVGFDKSDPWAIWMTCLDPTGTLSLTFDGASSAAITSFQFRLKNPWDLTFSSDASALLFAFGPQSGTSAARVPAPGLMTDESLLYFGLDPASTTQSLSSTVKDLAIFSGTSAVLPDEITSWTLTLEPSAASQKRNALWFDPSSMKTIVRLRFSVDGGTEILTSLLGGALPGLQFQSVDAVCKKTLVLAATETGPGAVQNGQFALQVACSISPKGTTGPVDMIASIECLQASYILTLTLTTPSALSRLLAWLGDLAAGASLDFINEILSKDGVFDGINPRQLKITLVTDDQTKKPSLSSFRAEIEVTATLGHSGSSPVVFLISYTWSKDIGGAGALSGEFWNWFDTSPTRDLSSAYEAVDDLCPLAQNPAPKISLLSLVPGQSIENFPANIPTEITRAYISLTQDGCLLGGIVQSDMWDSSQQYSVPQLDLGQLNLQMSFSWGKAASFQLSLGVLAEMKPSVSSKHQSSAYLTGSLDYDSSNKSWALQAALDGLYASTLYEFFDEASADHVMPLIDSIEIASVTLAYQYTAKTDSPAAGGVQSAGSHFKMEGLLLIAALELQLSFEYQDKGWTFSAQLAAQDSTATMGDILESILGDDGLDLPEFLANTPFSHDDGHSIDIDMKRVPKSTTEVSADGDSGGTFQFVALLSLGPLELIFAQFHDGNWPAAEPSKRLVKVALTQIPSFDIALIGRLEQPFDEMYYMWIQDSTGQNKAQTAGLTREEIKDINPSMGNSPLVPNDKVKDPQPEDLLIAAGSHLGIVIHDQSGGKTCILDYAFKKQAAAPGVGGATATKSSTAPATAPAGTSGDTPSDPADGTPDSDGNSSQAPFKKQAGPLSISNIGLKYANQALQVKLDATLLLGPLAFSLLGFSIDLKLTSLDLSKIEAPSFSLNGFSVVFDKTPLSIAGIVVHGSDATLNYYAGGLIVGWVPYQLEAAGFYGEATPQGTGSGKAFTSVFVFARLDGPLVTLEFAEISGVTGGFGYKSQVRVPAADQISNFPFIATQQLDGASGSALDALQRLTSPGQGGWFSPVDDAYWAAAGMKISAFKMLSLDAVAVLQFGQTVKMGLFGVAVVDVPNAAAPLKYAHVELGIAITVDPDIGVLVAEAQLSPNSYIIHPSCHLTGGFALCYWFDGPHANKALVGSFVFTLGGYHQAFQVPKGWPSPPRLGITWQLGSHLSVTGEAYFAITCKSCMAGGRLHALFSLGPIDAWFDAFADFLINYKPFHFSADAGVSVGVRLSIDFLFIHIHISIEISADLYLWGPPFGGRAHVDVKVTKFWINFGDDESDEPAVSLVDFYHLALQASSQSQAPVTEVVGNGTDKQPLNEAHVFLAQSGLLNNSQSPSREQNQDWVVRGGAFSFVVGCKMAVASAALVDVDNKTLNSVAYATNAIYAHPMHLETALESSLVVSILQDGVEADAADWGMDQVIKSVPAGLWAIYDATKDPTGGNNNIGDLLDADNGSIALMMGVVLTAPPAVMSQDRLPVFDIADAELVQICEKPFPPSRASQAAWEPDAPAQGAAQWDNVRGEWKSPSWDSAGGEGQGVQSQFVKAWAQAFNWDVGLQQLAGLPRLLDQRFNEIYMAAPLMTR